MRSRRSRRGAQQGVALIIVLWLTVLLTVVGGAFAFSMRSEALASRNAVSLAQARMAADGAIERATFELLRPRLKESWKADGVVRRWQDGAIGLAVSVRDESAKIDINGASDTLLKSLFLNVAGLDDAQAGFLVEAIADWRDADELRRPNGAEALDYRAVNSNYAPANGPFETVGELARVLGMTPTIFARVAAALTVHSRRPGVNPLTAERETLLALPGATSETVDDYMLRREEALASGTAVPPFPPAQGFLTPASPVWRIRAQATAPDGVTFVREAVVQATADPRRPFYALLWSEGSARLPAPAEAAAAAPPPTSPSNDDARRS